MFYVYVLSSEADSGVYIGYSSDLRRRIAQHKRGAAPATSYRGPWKLIYYEAYVEQADALGREKYPKERKRPHFSRKAASALSSETPSSPNRVSEAP